MRINISEEAADSPDAIQLVEELDEILVPGYPPESHHGYDVDKLVREGVAFFVTRCDGDAAGCGGIQLFGTEYGELKRMYVRPAFRRFGLAKKMLEHLTVYAAQHNVSMLRLETGIYQTEAIGLYERWGFYRIPPFGGYVEDPLSIFFEKPIRVNE
jgi:putative acetyltransferase